MVEAHRPDSRLRSFDDPKWRISFVGPGGMIQDRHGRPVAPRYKHEPFRAFALYSDDHGKSWQQSAFVPDQGWNECQLVELADGRLLMDMRQETGSRRSTLHQRRWRQSLSARRAGLPASPVECAIERYTLKSAGDDRDRIIWTGPKGPDRQNLVVRVSYDEGKTWPVERQVYSGPSAYSDLTILKDRSVGMLWERGIAHGYQYITFTRLTRSFSSPELCLGGSEVECRDRVTPWLSKNICDRAVLLSVPTCHQNSYT